MWTKGDGRSVEYLSHLNVRRLQLERIRKEVASSAPHRHRHFQGPSADQECSSRPRRAGPTRLALDNAGDGIIPAHCGFAPFQRHREVDADPFGSTAPDRAKSPRISRRLVHLHRAAFHADTLGGRLLSTTSSTLSSPATPIESQPSGIATLSSDRGLRPRAKRGSRMNNSSRTENVVALLQCPILWRTQTRRSPPRKVGFANFARTGANTPKSAGHSRAGYQRARSRPSPADPAASPGWRQRAAARARFVAGGRIKGGAA